MRLAKYYICFSVTSLINSIRQGYQCKIQFYHMTLNYFEVSFLALKHQGFAICEVDKASFHNVTRNSVNH